MPIDLGNIPEPYASIVRKVLDEDLQFFLDHPQAFKMQRAYVDSEFWPLSFEGIEGTAVARGENIEDRARAPMLRPSQMDKEIVWCIPCALHFSVPAGRDHVMKAHAAAGANGPASAAPRKVG